MNSELFGLPGSRTPNMDVRVDVRLLVPLLTSSDFEKELRELLVKYRVQLLEIDDGYIISKIEEYRPFIDEEKDG